MDHGGEAARPTTTVGSADLGTAGAVQGGEAHMSTGTFHGQLGAAAARRAGFDEFARHVHAAVGRRGEVPVAVFHHVPGPGVAYANIAASWQQPGPLDVVLSGLQLPDGVVPVHDSSFYSALQPHQGAGRGVVLADLLLVGSGGAVYSWDYVLQPHPGAGHGEVLVDLLPVPDGAGHGEVFISLLPGGVDAAYDDYAYYALQPRSGAGHGEVLVDLHPDGAGHGEVFVSLLPGGVDTAYDDYGYYPWQPRRGAGRGEVFIGPLPDGVGVVFDSSGNMAQQTLLGTGHADGIAGALRDPNLDAVNDDPGMAAEHLCRLLPFAGIGACSVAVNGLAAGPGSPAIAFHLFVLLLGGLFLVILHVLRV